MKNKLIILLVSTILILSALTSCTYIPKVSLDTVTRITLDAGAAVEFMVNRENDVVAATALNDQASVLLVNEDFLKISPDKAADKFMTLALESGFDGSKVKLSISGESDYVDVITEMIQKKIEKRLEKFGASASIEMVEPATADELRKIFLDGNFYTEEEMSLIGEGQLIYYLARCRLETAFLPSAELKRLYYISRYCNVDIYMAEERLGVIEYIANEYPDAYAAYAEAFNMLKESAIALEATAKELCLTSDHNEASVNEALEPYYSDFDVKKNAILSIEEAFPKEVTTALRKASYDIQTTLMAKRNNFPSAFKEKYRGEIDAVINELSDKKNDLIK